MSLTISATLDEIVNLNRDTVKQLPEQFAQLLQSFVEDGSQLHVLHIKDIRIFANPEWAFEGKETTKIKKIGTDTIALTLTGLMAAGAKFFDALVYLCLPEDRRPKYLLHAKPKKAELTYKFPTYNDLGQITKYIFVAYFFIIIRGHAPTETGDYKGQPMPKFISTVLGIRETTSVIADYLSSFPLTDINPAWVKHVTIGGISQEATSRFGLGVAGYRLVSVFNIAEPDLYRTTAKEEDIKESEKDCLPLEDKPKWLDDAVEVAKSFRAAGPCWDFHPATRSPNVLSKYGNINKNAANLILVSFKKDTIERLVRAKKLAVVPTEDLSHTEFRGWSRDMKYAATKLMYQSG